MSRRVLVIEPDATIRRMSEYALSAAGFAPVGASTIEACRAVLDRKPVEVALVELRATNSESTESVQALRADYPELPLIVTGTLLTPRALQELIRARVDDVLPKPFTPGQLVSTVQRVLHGARTRGNGGMEYAAAMAAARRAIVAGRPHDAEAPLERARATAPLDAEAMALLGVARELQGADREADRAYRAALALANEYVTDDGVAREGLARLRAYGGARAVPSFEHRGAHELWFVADPTSELALGPPAGTVPDVVVFALGLTPNEHGAIYSRVAAPKPAYLVATGAMSERLARRVTQSFEQPTLLGHERTLLRLAMLESVDTQPQSSDG
jgi:DNA-binding response OmpR family regulator